MPGVPSGRACEACRIARKKCDYRVPVCSRCLRLETTCIGSGQRRFMFKGPKCDRKPIHQAKDLCKLQQSPSNPDQPLVASLCKSISPETELRFSLLHSYGSYLRYIPQRLGLSEALDSAAEALVLSHHDLCTRQSASVRTIRAYITALCNLRNALDCPVEAVSVHTLGAAALLVICRDLNGFTIQEWSVHSLGVADIVHARRHVAPQDDFERQLLLSFQGYLVGHCVFFREMRLNPDRFEELVKTLADNLEPNNVLHYICNFPTLLQRRKLLYNDTQGTKRLFQEIYANYQALNTTRHKLRAHLDAVSRLERTSRLQHSYGYALALTLCLIYHCILSGSECEYGHRQKESDELTEATLRLAREVADLSPLGSGFMFLSLSVALACTADNAAKESLIKTELRKLQQSYRREGRIDNIVQSMKELRSDLLLESEM